MFSYLIISVLVTFGAANIIPVDRLNSQLYKYDRIVGGHLVSIKDFPYQVSFITNNQVFCGGSIINEYYVVTAAHCASLFKRAKIRAGSAHGYTGGKLYNIANVHIHHNSERNDIALVRVTPPFKFDENCQPIKIYKKADIKVGDFLTTSGFGLIGEKDSESIRLMAVSIPFVKREKCSKIYEKRGYDPVTPEFFCAEYTGNEGSCHGDSGGPATFQDQLVGIVSYGLGCGRPKIPGVYANVTYYAEWIEKHMHL